MARKSDKKDLVIVESPAKAKTINKYLGDGYVVKASMGHVRDLPSKGMGVDLTTFIPAYEDLASRGKVITELKKLAKDSNKVYLATDLDREGEAIAWHLKESLGVPDERAHRVIFNAITKSEIEKAFKNPLAIDIDRVNAQQARRILDRIVGYEISPLLWRKVARGLSAGRVQSVAVRLIVEREREIEAFLPEEFWKIGAVFTAETGAAVEKLIAQWQKFLSEGEGGERTKADRERWLADHAAFSAELVDIGGKKFDANNKADALRIAQLLGFALQKDQTTEDPEGKGPARNLTRLIGGMAKAPQFAVDNIERKRTTSKPSAPFITSTLQQAASTRMGYGAQRTMRLAQTLYESGYITYMRTDSTNLSKDAVDMARSYIGKNFGDAYLPASAPVYSSTNKSAQEAHEAIRPTDANFGPEQAHGKLGPDESKLYQLIWKRFVACQMTPAQFDQTTVSIGAPTTDGKATFRASGRKLVFDGFMRVAGVSSEDQLLPEFSEGSKLSPIEVTPTQHFTQPPPRFTEASLVKMLEQLGIGRPSTYASIISTIQDREYVQQINRRFFATMLGSIVTDKLIQGFPEIMDVKFTADMELKLDKIEEQHLNWIQLLKDFYGPFHVEVERALDKLDHAGGTPSKYTCPKCGGKMLYRISKNGFFLACENRECSQTQPVDQQGKPTVREVSEYACPVCNRPMIKRRGRFGEFLGCSGYSEKNEKGEPSCTCIINLDKEGKPQAPKPAPIVTDIKCDKCGSPMLLRDSKRGPFLGCSTFPKCRSTKMAKKLEGDDLKKIEALVPELAERAKTAQGLIAKLTGGEVPATAAPTGGPITTDIDCEECGKPMVIREGRKGKFLGCSGYPKCKNTAEVPAKVLEELAANAATTPDKKDARSATDLTRDDPGE